MRLHLIGLFHTIPKPEYSHCAFTGRVFRFGKMMLPFGYEIIEYSNEGSEAQSSEHVCILETEEFERLKALYKQEQPNEAASTDSTLYKRFRQVLDRELLKRVEPGDIICHPFGIAHSYLKNDIPYAKHIEIGIGYVEAFADFRVYETYQWWAWHQGKEQKPGNAYQWVCPMAYDIDEWEPSYETGDYLLYFGRVIDSKGIEIVKEISKYTDLPVKIVGNGPQFYIDMVMQDSPSNLSVHGPVTGTARSELLRNARAMLMPTLYTEPFGGAGVEGTLCGTPLISSDFGAFSETVQHGYNGFRCKTLGDWLSAIKASTDLNRRAIASTARAKYSLANCGQQMDKIFRQVKGLDEKGWYSLEPTHAIWE